MANLKQGAHYDYYDNEHPQKVLAPLRALLTRRVNDKRCAYFYIGQTTNPKARFDQHQERMAAEGYSTWDWMQVVYGHRSLGFVTDVENALIEHLRQHPKFAEKGFNAAGSRYAGRQTYCVYVLIDSNQNAYVNRVPDDHFCHQETNKRASKVEMETIIKDNFRLAIKEGDNNRTADWIYVGYTNDPNRRFREHQLEMNRHYEGNIWDQMLVLYQTPSLDKAILAESVLIEHATRYYGKHCLNTIEGRVRRDESTYYYVYFLEEFA